MHYSHSTQAIWNAKRARRVIEEDVQSFKKKLIRTGIITSIYASAAFGTFVAMRIFHG